MKRIHYPNTKSAFSFSAVFLILILTAGIAEARTDMEIVRERVVAELMDAPVDDEQVASLLESLSSDGSWPGIDYEDTSRTGFRHREHYANLVALARAYRKPGSVFQGDDRVREVLVKALSFWVENDFRCDNWWYNQIGTPRSLLTVLLLMGDELPSALVETTKPIVERSHVNAWGARQSGDRIKIAGIQAKYLLLTGDQELFDEIVAIIEGEIKFSTGRGMQHDFSFHHRVDRVNNTLSYGLDYANVFAEWAALVAGTKYAFSDESLHQLIDYYLDGICRHMVFGWKPDFGARNRAISRPRALKPHGTEALNHLVATSDYRKDELKEIIAIRQGEAKPSRSHATFYWQSEHFTLQRPGFFTSVRMHSRRNQTMEYPYNGEGILNHHRGDGANHLFINGHEYDEIAPVFDFQKVPGTTSLQSTNLPPETEVRKPGLTDFVGAVTDGFYGAVAFDFISPHDPVRAKKAWFFFYEEYVCLGAGIEGHVDLPVATTLAQSLLRGDVHANFGGKELTLESGNHKLSDVEWILHDGVGFLFPEPVDLQLSNQEQTGSWHRINRQTTSSKKQLAMDVFKLWIDHGPRPTEEHYEYMVVPSVDLAGIQQENNFRGLKILSNTNLLQAVRHDGLDLCQAVFYASGTLQVTEHLSLSCDSQGIVMAKYDANGLQKLTVADPSRKLKRIRLSTNQRLPDHGEGYSVDWDEAQGISYITIDLPQDPYAGKSVTLKF